MCCMHATLFLTCTFSLSKQFRMDNQSTNLAIEVAALYLTALKRTSSTTLAAMRT